MKVLGGRVVGKLASPKCFESEQGGAEAHHLFIFPFVLVGSFPDTAHISLCRFGRIPF